MDLAAIATAIIGLDSITGDADRPERRVARDVTPHRRAHAARERLANTLRTAAERIAPSPTPA
jgi:hypothetical protein